MSDPTGTRLLRRAFLAEGNRRLGQVRSLTHTMLVEHDLMQARDTPWAQLFPQPGHRLSVFAEWFARMANELLLSAGWWEKYLQRAYDSGLVAGGELVRSLPPSGPAPVPAVYGELARRELAGIVAALVQQVSRQAGAAALTRQMPQMMYRQVLTAIRKVGMMRLQMFVNYMTVKLHNAARLEQFRTAGIMRVGIIPELLEPAKPSRFLKRDHALHDHCWHDRKKAEPATTMVNVLTAGDNKVCAICKGIADDGPYTVAKAEGIIPAHPNCRCVFVVDVGEDVPYGLRGVEPGRQVVIKPVYQGAPISGKPPEAPSLSSLTGIARTGAAPTAPLPTGLPEEIARFTLGGATTAGLARIVGMVQELTTSAKISGFLGRIVRPEDFILAIANVPHAPNPDLLIEELIALARRREWEYLIPAAWAVGRA